MGLIPAYQGPQRVALYARISPTPEGKAGENYSIKSQLYEGRQKSLQEFGCAEPDEFIDRNQMGGTLDRPALDRLRDAIAMHMYDIVIVYSPDRWTREPNDKIILSRELEKGGAKLVYVTVTYEDSAEGELSEGVQDVVSRYEKRKFKERSRRCRRQKSRDGHPHACHAPDGYVYVGQSAGKRGEYAIVPERAKVVLLIFQKTAEGISQSELSIWLNEQGIPTQKGNRWLPASVSQLLRNPAYSGVLIQNGVEIRIPEIIPPKLYRKAMELKGLHSTRAGREPRHYLLSGMIYCARCGKRVNSQARPHGSRAAYWCSNINPFNRSERYCHAPSICKDRLEAAVWEAVWDTVCDPGLLWEMIEAYYDRMAAKQGKGKDPAIAQIDKARRRLQRATEIMNDPDHPTPYAEAKANVLAAQRDLAVAEARGDKAAVIEMPKRKDIAAVSAHFRAMREELESFEARRAALKQLVGKILFADAKAEIHCRIAKATAQNRNRRISGDCNLISAIPFVINCKVTLPPPGDRAQRGADGRWRAA